MRHRVLLVEDDSGLRETVARALRAEGYDVVTAADGTQAVRTSTTSPFDAIVLDIGLPDSDGRDVCQALRAQGFTGGVLFLTARSGVTDLLSGFSSGGDDYLPKPFAMVELVARLRAVLKRTSSPAASYADLVVDPVSHTVGANGSQLAVSPTEFRLLAALMAAPGAVVRRRQLIEAAWPTGAIVSDNTLDQYVRRVRRKLEDLGSVHTIQTARGIGYRLA
jgi:two-component system response regulator MprA